MQARLLIVYRAEYIFDKILIAKAKREQAEAAEALRLQAVEDAKSNLQKACDRFRIWICGFFKK